MINNRQSGRRRGRGGSSQQQRSSGGGSGQRDSGNRIDSRARGNAAQLLEKYKNMARDAQMSGDRVNTEHYLQFADHYFRVLSDSRARNDEQRPKSANESFEEDDDYGDEGEPIRAGDQPMARDDSRRDTQSRDDQPRESGSRNSGYRDNQSRDGQSRDGHYRDSQSRDYQSRDVNRAPRDDGRSSAPRDDNRSSAPRDDNRSSSQRDDGRSSSQRDDSRSYQHRDQDQQRTSSRDDHAASANGHAGAPVTEASVDAAQPERAPTRSRRRTPAPPPIENGEDAAVLEADRLPPALSISQAAPADADAAEEKPKRRRGRPPAAEVQAG